LDYCVALHRNLQSVYSFEFIYMMIAKISIKVAAALMLSILSFGSMASHDEGHEAHEGVHANVSHENGGPINTPEAINEYKKHHLQDSHDFVFYTDGETGEHVGFPLLVILVDNGLQVFSSSKFHHGESVAESNGNYYKLHHGKVYKTDAEGTLEMEHGHPHNAKPLDLSITKNVVGMLLTSALMLLAFSSLARGYKKGPIPTGFARVLEPLVLFVRDEIARPNIGEKKYKRFMSFLLTVFFFIWILNLLGLTPLAFNVTGNIAVTVCLALFTFIIVQFSANKEYWGHIFWMPGVPAPMKIVLAPIEFLGLFTKPFSLLIRLFANITAGHFVVMSLIALTITMKAAFGPAISVGTSVLLTLFISLIEILVAFLQAYIFTMLSSLFIGMAVVEHDHH